MSLIKYNLSPNFKNDLFSPFEHVFNEFYNDFFKNTSNLDKIRAQSGYPKMDIISENNQIIIRAAIPGVAPEDIRVEMVDDQTVEISGKSEDEYIKKESSSFFINELSKRKFSRRVTLPYILGDPNEAKIKNGILTLIWNIKEKEPEPERRFISIES